MRFGLLSVFIAFAALFLFVFPLSMPGSSVFYVSLSFFLIALFLSSKGKGLMGGLGYLRIFPQKKGAFSLASWAIAGFAASCLVTALVSAALFFLGLLDTGKVAEKVSDFPLHVLVAAFTIAPFAEEALFRGYLFRKIADSTFGMGGFGLVLAAFISSALFAALHIPYGSVAEVAVAFFVGITLCALAYKSDSLLPAMAAHMLFNFLSIALMVLG